MKRNIFSIVFLMIVIFTLGMIIAGCGDDDDDDDDSAGDDDDDDNNDDDNDDDDTVSMEFEAGYQVIEQINFTLRNSKSEEDFTSAETRIWYAFQPAEESPESKPLVLFFNGGPGCATHFLFGFGTAMWSLEPENPIPFENPNTWRQSANLLYIDARGTGLSYGMTADPSDEDERVAEFGTKNYNVYIDAADFIRVLLRFLDDHPVIQSNPVIIVGESYGGTRSTAMLNILLKYKDFGGTGEVYQDTALSAEIQNHLDAVFPDASGDKHEPEAIAGQFGHQILIEPLVTGNNQFELTGAIYETPGSIIYQIASETSTTYTPCDPGDTECDPFDNALSFLHDVADRDYYVYPKPAEWTFEQGYLAVDQLTTADGLAQMTQIDPLDISYLYATERDLAYRVGVIEKQKGAMNQSLPPFARLPLQQCLKYKMDTKQEADGELPATFGDLNPWDTYHIDCSEDIEYAFYSETAEDYGIDPVNKDFGVMFLYNLVYVNTFITNASYDLIIYAPVIPDTLALYPNYVKSSNHITTATNGEDRPGWIEVTYQDGAFGVIEGNETRMIRFPVYGQSGHTVELNQPGDLYADSMEWIQNLAQ